MSLVAFQYAAHQRATINFPPSVQQYALQAHGAILSTIKAAATTVATARIEGENSPHAEAAQRTRVYCMVPTLEEAEQREYWKVILETWDAIATSFGSSWMETRRASTITSIRP